MNIAVIPARGGSKRVPRKNLRTFVGKPMIAWTIEAALRSGVFDAVLVSTDDQEIAETAERWGAQVPFHRPSELADDYATTADVMTHAVAWATSKHQALHAVCCLYATAPFIDEADIRRGLLELTSSDWDYVFTATEYASSVFRAFKTTDDGGVSMLFPEHLGTRSQDLPEVLHDAAQFYWARPGTWLAQRPIFGHRSKPLRLPRWRVQDIDTMADWELAERLAPYLLEHEDDA